MTVSADSPVYVLGHTDRELERLISQSRILGELTEDVLRRAGIGAGMHVLDLGCGAGDVSFLLASLVGPTGSVLGVDRSPEAVRVARERAAHAQLGWVTFRESELADVTCDSPVDAIVGRFVLPYLADPVTVLQRLCRHVRPGGLVIFQEMDITTARCVPPVPLYDRSVGWIAETFRRGGVERDMGSRLFATFRRAGLPAPEMLLRARVEGAADSPAYAYVASTIRSLLPMAERLGVATAAEVDVDTLGERLRDEVQRAEAVMILPSLVGAWARIPGGSSASRSG